MEFLKLYFQNLTLYDYIGIGIVGIVFLLLFILSLILLFKKPFLGFLIFLLSFLILPFGIFGIKDFLNQTLRKSEFVIKKAKPLHFSNSLLIEAQIRNLSKIDFRQCFIQLKIIKKSNSKLKNFLFTLKPLQIKTIYLYKPIPKNSSYILKKILDNVTYNKNEKLISEIACY